MSFTIGIDYGTKPVRAIVVDYADGREVGSCVGNYPSGRHGVLLDPRHHHVARPGGQPRTGLERVTTNVMCNTPYSPAKLT
jgi:L-ribulokinase